MIEQELRLAFSVNRLVLAEKELGTPIAHIVEELETGAPSFTTLRALVAVGTIPEHIINLGGAMGHFLDLNGAGKKMEQHGTMAVSGAVGQAMKTFLESLSR